MAVCAEDTDLQWFNWGGQAFKELCLIFECVSSADIFDRLAQIVLFIVARKSGFLQDMVCQHLDDCCAAAPYNSDALEAYDLTFIDIASKLGVMIQRSLLAQNSLALFLGCTMTQLPGPGLCQRRSCFGFCTCFAIFCWWTAVNNI